MSGTANKSLSPVLWPLLGLLGLIVLNLVLDPGFLKVSVIDGRLYGMPVDIFNQGARGLLLALGMTLVIATGGVDLSVGSVMALAGAVAAMGLGLGWGLAPALGAALAVALAAGGANALLVARLGIQPIVATLILMVVGRGAAQLITGGEVVVVKSEAFAFIGNGQVAGLPFAPLLAIGLFVVAHLVLRKTAAGLFVEAVGDNETAARFAGVSAARVRAGAYLFCGLCAGLAGLMAAANIRAADPYRMGENMELDAIFAVVVGGTALSGGRFLLLGSFAGALLLQTLTVTVYNLGVPPAVAPVPKALLILLVCVLQSQRVRRWGSGLVRGGSR
jgi:galactofuranose transport system permease protein